jgi:inosine/xanthosine triphosphate pyrophosphatase family protein
VLDISKFSLVTSNRNKLAEYRAFGLPDLTLAEGLDLPEVDGSPDDVILYKALAAGEGMIVEDTVLYIDGSPVVDIRWQLDSLVAVVGKTARWDVRLGILHEGVVQVFVASVDGKIVKPRGEGFGFDPFFEVSTTQMTLAELAAAGCKADHSARKFAVDNLLMDAPVIRLKQSDIPEWSGGFQH